jgi:cystathionine beta-lyase/cystathionine gamma-synthase
MKMVNYDDAELGKGDVFWIESPRNPDCILQDIQEISERAHKLGAYVVVDRFLLVIILCSDL